MSKPALGRGLGALLGGMPAQAPTPARPQAAPAGETAEAATVRIVPLMAVQPCSLQPRKAFAEESLRELADSIREQGIVQPLIVRRQGTDGFELVAGERRWRAARLAGLTEVPVLVREVDDREALELALIENLQRENLNPMEEAQGFARLIEQFELTQEEAATRVGKSRVVVANALRLLKLPAGVQAFVRDGLLSVGHAKAILGLSSLPEQQLAADRVLRQSLTVRQTEEMVSNWRSDAIEPRAPGEKRLAMGDPHVQRIQDRIRERVGTKVQIRYREGKGSIQIQFFSDDDLERVLEVLGVSAE